MRKTLLALSLALAPLLAHATPAVDHPWVRPVPPAQKISAAFMVLKNPDAKADALISASTPAAQTVELHATIADGNVMRMRQQDKIPLPARGQTELKPGGYHLMLINLKQPLKTGDKVPLTLKFQSGSIIELEAPVEDRTGMPPGHEHHH